MAEEPQFADQGTADALEIGLREEQDRLHAAQLAIDVGLLALILKIFDVAHTTDDEACPLATGHIDGQVAIRAHTHPRVVLIERGDGGHALGYFLLRMLPLAHGHGDDKVVEKRKDPTHYRRMASSEGVESAREEGDAAILVCFHTCFSSFNRKGLAASRCQHRDCAPGARRPTVWRRVRAACA